MSSVPDDTSTVVAVPAPAPESAPKVSVIIPVYNTEKYLRECLDSVLNQSLRDIEIICVDDGSTDSSPQILEEYAARDSRVKILRQKNAGAGAARNFGIDKARGEFLYFFDSDDLCDKQLLELTVDKAKQTGADIVAFDFLRFYPDGRTENRVGINLGLLSSEKEVFNYSDCPDRILSIINPTPWNKLFRAKFVRENDLRFEEISSTNDVTFCAVSSAKARKIAFIKRNLFSYRWSHGGTITSTKQKNLGNIVTALVSVERQVNALPYGNEIAASLAYFCICNYLFGLFNCVKDFSLPVSKSYYETVREYFLRPEFDSLTRERFRSNENFNRFLIVRKHDYETFCRLKSPRLIVSLTSWPGRIGGLHLVLETIFNQTLAPDEIVLWLAESQFPHREKDLPKSLRDLANSGRISVRWCKTDLRPHKKYFYAFQQYPDDIIVTVDDDLLYRPNLLQQLYDSYLLHPKAVSSARVHLIRFTADGDVRPYKDWVKESNILLYEPSMQLLATGGSGVLYPPHLLEKSMLDEGAILETCLTADDLWMKAMEAVAGVPVVLVAKNALLKYLPDSQKVTLYKHNGGEKDMNTVYFGKIAEWVDSRFGAGTLKKCLLSGDCGVCLVDGGVKPQGALARPAPQSVPAEEKPKKPRSVPVPAYRPPRQYPRILVRLAALFIFNKAKRKRFRERHMDLNPRDGIDVNAMTDAQRRELERKKSGRNVVRRLFNSIVPATRSKTENTERHILRDNEARSNRLLAELRAARKEIAAARAETEKRLSEQSEILASARESLAGMREELSATRAELASARAETEKRLSEQSEILASARESLAGTREELSATRAELASARAETEKRLSELSKKTEEARKQSADALAALRKELSDARKELDSARKEIAGARNDTNRRIAALAGTQAKLQTALTRVEGRTVAASGSVAALVAGIRLEPTGTLPRKIQDWYFSKTGKPLNLAAPKTYCEKMQWLKAYDVTPEKTRLTDKLAVREWVAEKVGEKYVVPVLGVWNAFDEIDFDALPQQFVLKATHGSRFNIVVPDKSVLDLADAKRKFDAWLAEKFEFHYGFEMHYAGIPPRIIAEPFLEFDESGAPDWQVFCFNGKPEFVLVILGGAHADDHGTRIFYDLNWKKLPFTRLRTEVPPNEIPRPENLDEMLAVAGTLCRGFRHVCVDFFRLRDGSWRFAEMTFTRASGLMEVFPPEYDRWIGDKLVLPTDADAESAGGNA